jgi:hypothetical protein
VFFKRTLCHANGIDNKEYKRSNKEERNEKMGLVIDTNIWMFLSVV